MQSPKSQRPHAPGETPGSSDGSVTDKGGTHAEHHGSGPSSPSVPSGLDRSPGRHQGNVKAESYVPVGPRTPSQAGGPKYVTNNPANSQKGGSEHIT